MLEVFLRWLNPAAWWGLAALVVPVIIHLIARHRARRLLFPSLEFIPSAPAAALRRRVITAWPLLLVRLAILAIAVAALAGPVFVTGARRAEWDQRIARATVSTTTDEAGARGRIADERASSFLHAHFSAVHLLDAIRAAVDWLDEQPPAARELVVIGDLREGVLTERDLDVIPSVVGLRFQSIDGDSVGGARRSQLIADAGTGRLAHFDLEVKPDLTTTAVRYTPSTGSELRVTTDAGPTQQARADAVLTAVLREGVLVNADRSREIVVAFDGAKIGDGMSPPGAAWMREVLERIPEARGSERNGALIVRVAMPVTDPRAPAVVAQVVGRSFADSFAPLEPRRLAPGTLAAWSRSPGPSPPDVLPADEGDRRWFWMMVLVLLGVEYLIGREPKGSPAAA